MTGSGDDPKVGLLPLVNVQGSDLTEIGPEVKEFLKPLARIARRLTRQNGLPDDASKNGGRT